MARGGPKLDHGRRQELGQSFQDGGEHYHRVRPGYPAESADWLIPAGARDCRRHRSRHRQVHRAAGGTRPARQRGGSLPGHARAAPQRLPRGGGAGGNRGGHGACPARRSTSSPWRRHGTGATRCGPAPRSPGSCGRGGVLGLIWNQLDTSVPWVHRLSRIMHAGDVHKPRLPAPAGARNSPDWKAT